MPVSRFMALALQHPEHGYYRRANAIGRDGDFITSPEINQVFGELCGLWLVSMWDQIGRPGRCVLCEAGPGKGTLTADAHRAIRSVLPAFADVVDIFLIDSNETLKAKQREILSGCPLQWGDTLETLPPAPLFFVANEFLDALPVHQLVRTDGCWRERVVAMDADDNLVFAAGDSLSGELQAVGLSLPHDCADGYVHEVQPDAFMVMRGLSQHLVTHGGVALLFDYGGNLPVGASSLRGYRSHEQVDPLTYAGETDLTVDVDFQALSRAARETGAKFYGPVDQGAFLLTIGVEARRQTLKNAADMETAAAIDTAVDRLVDPAGMGTLFKVIAVAAPSLGSLPGFAA